MLMRRWLPLLTATLLASTRQAAALMFHTAHPAPRRTSAPTLCDFSDTTCWDDWHADNSNHEWLLPYDGTLATRLRAGLRGLPKNAPLLERALLRSNDNPLAQGMRY